MNNNANIKVEYIEHVKMFLYIRGQLVAGKLLRKGTFRCQRNNSVFDNVGARMCRKRPEGEVYAYLELISGEEDIILGDLLVQENGETYRDCVETGAGHKF